MTENSLPLSDRSTPHREWECPVDGCPVCMPPIGVVISMEEKAEFECLRAENERLREALAAIVDVRSSSNFAEINRALDTGYALIRELSGPVDEKGWSDG